MKCEDAELWFSLAFDGRLDDAERAEFQAHLDACPSCAGAYARYEMLFGAVRAIPSTTTDRPAPIPTSAASFSAPRPQVSFWGRMSRLGGVAGLLVAIGFGAYELGSASRPDATTSTIQNAASLVDSDVTTRVTVPPAKLPGGYLHRLVRGTKNLGLMVESAGNGKAVREEDADVALRVIDDYVQRATIDADARRLRRFDATSLGGYTGPVHDFARDASALVEEAQRELGDARAPQERLQSLRAIMRRGSLRHHIDKLGRLAELYPLPPRPQAPSFPGGGQDEWAAGPALASSMQFLVCGDADQAGQLMIQVLTTGDGATRKFAQRMAFFNRLDLDGVRFIEAKGGLRAEDAASRFVLPAEAWGWSDHPPFFRAESGQGITIEKPGQEVEIIMSIDGRLARPQVIEIPESAPKGIRLRRKGARRRL